MQSSCRKVVFHVSIGKGSYVSLRAGKVKPQVRAKNLPCDIRCEVFFAETLPALDTSQTCLCETKTTDPTGRRIKKGQIYGKQEKSSVKLQLPHLSNPHKN